MLFKPIYYQRSESILEKTNKDLIGFAFAIASFFFVLAVGAGWGAKYHHEKTHHYHHHHKK